VTSFIPYRTWIIGDKWLSQYPPGWPLVLAMAIVAGIPHRDRQLRSWAPAVSPASGRLCGISGTARCRSAVIALYLGTTFYLLNAASFYSHMLPALLSFYSSAWPVFGTNATVQRGLYWPAARSSVLIGLTRYFSLVLVLPALAYGMFVKTALGECAYLPW